MSSGEPSDDVEKAPLLPTDGEGPRERRGMRVLCCCGPLIKGAEDASTRKLATVDDAIERIGLGWFQWKIFILCGMGSFVEACKSTFSSPALLVLRLFLCCLPFLFLSLVFLFGFRV
jgi:hypothetical protein